MSSTRKYHWQRVDKNQNFFYSFNMLINLSILQYVIDIIVSIKYWSVLLIVYPTLVRKTEIIFFCRLCTRTKSIDRRVVLPIPMAPSNERGKNRTVTLVSLTPRVLVRILYKLFYWKRALVRKSFSAGNVAAHVDYTLFDYFYPLLLLL